MSSHEYMDLHRAIRELCRERERLDRIIASLEDLARAGANPAPPPGLSLRRRGRKAMDAGERREVSERMKRYWARQRGSGQGDPKPS